MIGSTYRLTIPKYLLEKLKTWKDGKTTVAYKLEDNVVRKTILSSLNSRFRTKIHGNLSCLYVETDLSSDKIIPRYANGPRIA